MKSLNTQHGGDHYKNFVIQPVEYNLKNGMGFCEGSAIKYITRHGVKGGSQDIQKAIHFCQMILESVYGIPSDIEYDHGYGPSEKEENTTQLPAVGSSWDYDQTEKKDETPKQQTPFMRPKREGLDPDIRYARNETKGQWEVVADGEYFVVRWNLCNDFEEFLYVDVKHTHKEAADVAEWMELKGVKPSHHSVWVKREADFAREKLNKKPPLSKAEQKKAWMVHESCLLDANKRDLNAPEGWEVIAMFNGAKTCYGIRWSTPSHTGHFLYVVKYIDYEFAEQNVKWREEKGIRPEHYDIWNKKLLGSEENNDLPYSDYDCKIRPARLKWDDAKSYDAWSDGEWEVVAEYTEDDKAFGYGVRWNRCSRSRKYLYEGLWREQNDAVRRANHLNNTETYPSQVLAKWDDEK